MNWVFTQILLLDAATAVVEFAVNWLLQSTILISAGLAAGWLLRRQGAALQSAIYRTTLAAVIACPLTTSLLAWAGVSGWSVEWPTAWTYTQRSSPPHSDPTPSHAVVLTDRPTPAVPADDAPSMEREGTFPKTAGDNSRLGHTAQQESDGNVPAEGEFANTSPEEVDSAPASSKLARSAQPVSAETTATVPAGMALFRIRASGLIAVGLSLAWLVVSTILLLRLAWAWRWIHRLREHATPAEESTQDVCRELAESLAISAPDVLRSPYLVSPCLVGVLRTVVLLPEAGLPMPIRDMLIHELAHVRRRDCAWNLLRCVAQAVCFYQPLLWILSRRLEVAAEEVCDDYVVELGGDRENYARRLLDIAELHSQPARAAGVTMVSLRSILAQRVTRILDPSRSLSTRAGKTLLTLVVVGGLAGTAIVGLVGLNSPSSLAESKVESKTGAENSPEASNDEEKTAAGSDKDNETGTGSATQAVTQQAGADKSTKNEAATDERLEGRVTGVDGNPVAGAKLYWIRSRVHDLDPQPPRLLATTGADGRYSFALPPPVSEDVPASWNYTDRIVVLAPGHGFTLTWPAAIRRAMDQPNDPRGKRAALRDRDEPTRLPAAGEPIRGRLVDVDGQPVVGARVRIRWFNEEGAGRSNVREAEARGVENAAWHARVVDLLSVLEPVQLRDVLPSATTDAEGRFVLRDIGAKRFVQLLVEREGFESTEIIARNEPGETIVIKPDRNWLHRARTVYPNEFLHAVGPSKPVEGRVLDLDTGEPIAGAVVRAFRVHGERVSSSRERQHFATRTDAEGRYRITGLPVGKDNELVAFATDDTAYLATGHAVDTSAPGPVIERDFRLKRGVWAEGCVFDAETDKPFTGELRYYYFRNADLEQKIPGLRAAFLDGLYWTNAKGEFRIPVLPTRGILAYRYSGNSRDRDGIDRYPRGFGAEDIAGSEQLGGGTVFPTRPHYLIPSNYTRLVEVNPTEGQKSVRVEMPLHASRPVIVRAVDPAGRPVVGFQAYGTSERSGWRRTEGPQFEIEDLRPGERRKVLIFHRERNLAGGSFVKHDAEDVVEIQLVEAGRIEGRLVNADGEPIDDAKIIVQYEKLKSDDDSATWAPHPDLRAVPTKIPVDENGRFRLDGLIPGWSYHAFASAPREFQGRTQDIIIGTPFENVRIEAGETKNLGDILINPQPLPGN